jgi:hypothetical protein
MDVFEAGIQVIWLPWPGHKVLGEVIAVSGNRVRIAFEGRGLKGEPRVFRFWVNPKWLRAVCEQCHYFEAMPNSQSCAACWNWKMAEDYEEIEERAVEQAEEVAAV